ncbi:MAG TPA: hypothetical protein VLT82_01645 [Myxococcaceae bacterium]|nr:hypothetical protein [Myxococcaceae bacterium]
MSRATFKLAEQAGPDSNPGASIPALPMQQLWFSIQRLPWASLVLVPADPGTSSQEVGKALHDVGKLTMGDRLRMLDARGLQLPATAPLILDMSGAAPVRPAATEWSERVLVLVDSVLSQPSGIPIALAADAVVLCLTLGKTPVAAARETVKLIGAQRFVGCITIP